jgi:HPt (histidine-containing phosphotransfer) domain-containing protein
MARPQALAPHYLSVGEQPVVADARPLDLAHLSRQTMGDRALEAEILGMFSRQLSSATGTLAKANGLERKRLAHSLKGTGRGVGAFALADIAERMELAPFDRAIIAELDHCIAQTCDFIASLNR